MAVFWCVCVLCVVSPHCVLVCQHSGACRLSAWSLHDVSTCPWLWSGACDALRIWRPYRAAAPLPYVFFWRSRRVCVDLLVGWRHGW